MKINNLSQKIFILVLVLYGLCFSSCTILKAGNYASDVFMRETDPELAKSALPTMIKVCEALYFADTGNEAKAVQAASMYVMYANVFIDAEAFVLPDDAYLEKMEASERSASLYNRAAKIMMPFAEKKAKNLFTETDKTKINSNFKKADVKLMYWTAAAILSAFSANPMDFEIGTKVTGAVFLFEEAIKLDPTWNNGSLLDLAVTLYSSLPADLGGSKEKAIEAFETAVKFSDDRSPGPYLSIAQSIFAKNGDREGFLTYLTKAVDMPVRAEAALMDTISKKKAQKLLDEIDMYFMPIDEGNYE